MSGGILMAFPSWVDIIDCHRHDYRVHKHGQYLASISAGRSRAAEKDLIQNPQQYGILYQEAL